MRQAERRLASWAFAGGAKVHAQLQGQSQGDLTFPSRRPQFENRIYSLVFPCFLNLRTHS